MAQDLSHKFLVISGRVITLTETIYFSSGTPVKVWKDDYGTIWALKEKSAGLADPVDRCGIGWLSLDPTHPLTVACVVHDGMYSNLVYQLFHTREEADRALRSLAKKVAKDLKAPWYTPFGEIFFKLSRWFGSRYWEVEKTNN